MTDAVAPPSLRDTASTLSARRGGVDTLQQAMSRVRAEVAAPHRHIAACTQQRARAAATARQLMASLDAENGYDLSMLTTTEQRNPCTLVSQRAASQVAFS